MLSPVGIGRVAAQRRARRVGGGALIDRPEAGGAVLDADGERITRNLGLRRRQPVVLARTAGRDACQPQDIGELHGVLHSPRYPTSVDS
jgi:hypothetical protein